MRQVNLTKFKIKYWLGDSFHIEYVYIEDGSYDNIKDIEQMYEFKYKDIFVDKEEEIKILLRE